MSEEKDDSQKTEQPTAQKLEKAREKGQTALSKEISHWLFFLVMIIVIGMILPSSLVKTISILATIFEQVGVYSIEENGLISLFSMVSKEIGLSFVGILLLLMAAGVAAAIGQTQFLISFESLKPKFDKISPIQGFKKLFGFKSWIELLKNMLKLILIAGVTIYVIWPEIHFLVSFVYMDTSGFLSQLQSLTLRFLVSIFSTLTLVTALDYGYQKFSFLKDLMMSKQEVKEEMKESEGDPHIKARMRRMRRDHVKQRVSKDVPEATVIITNPTHYSIALKYDQKTMKAPVLVAKGVDHLALKIREIAKDHHIPIIENPPVARGLYQSLEVGEEIPYEYYEVIANILRYIISLQ